MAEVIRATSIEQAVDCLRQAEDGFFLAGGQTLLPAIKQRLSRPTALILLADIPELKTITVSANSVTIGAMATHDDIARHGQLAKTIPSLCHLAGRIGDPAVRNQGTLGGSVANNDPAACYPGACLALDAEIETSQARRVPADEFFVGSFTTTLEHGEMVTAVRFRVPDKSCYVKFPQPASRFALVGVYVAYFGKQIRVAVTGAGQEGSFRCQAIEEALTNDKSNLDSVDFSALEADLITDIHANTAYRAALIKALTQQALASL